MNTSKRRRSVFAAAFGVDCMIPYLMLVDGPYSNPLDYLALAALFSSGIVLGWLALGRNVNNHTTIDLRGASVAHELESTVDLRVGV